jgi:hypothetical protein
VLMHNLLLQIVVVVVEVLILDLPAVVLMVL